MARLQHLNHDEFDYNIVVNNSNNRDVIGTVRIFIAPKFDETGRHLNLNDQRLLMIEMDKFTAICKIFRYRLRLQIICDFLRGIDISYLLIHLCTYLKTVRRGQNTITRKSTDSSLTITFEATFRNLDENRPSDDDIRELDRFNFCGCGWPQHMLVSKGTAEGYLMDMFVMISNYEFDKVASYLEILIYNKILTIKKIGYKDQVGHKKLFFLQVDQEGPVGCRTGISFCGLRDRKYPDARSMGFPFDRVARQGVSTMQDFLTPNMKLQQITVRFSDTVKPRKPSGTQSVIRL